MHVCDKCQRIVERGNDAVMIESIMQEEWNKDHEEQEQLSRVPGFMLLMCAPRHFLPIIEDGKIICSGSPSRAQYIEGQPKDTRGYRYSEEHEKYYRKAYKIAQQEIVAANK